MIQSLRSMTRNNKIALTSCNNVLSIAPDACHESDCVIRALKRLDVDAEVVTWDDESIDWSKYAGVIISQTWDYSQKFDHFTQWLRKTATKTAVFNSPPIVQWNADKVYLKQLESLGVRIVPTVWVDATTSEDEAQLTRILDQKKWSSLVMKASVGCNADSVKRFNTYNADAHAYASSLIAMGHSTILIQPYLQAIRTFGEVSMIYIDNTFSHAVLKTPAAEKEEFRVQEKFGGAYRMIEVTEGMLEACAKVVAGVQQLFPRFTDAPLYCRIDMIPLNIEEVVDIAECDFGVSEVELIEPYLYLSNTSALLTQEGKMTGEERLAIAIKQRIEMTADRDVYAVLRVDTHGNRFVVEQELSLADAKAIEAKFDALPHHQGYYVVRQEDVASELSRVK